MVALQVTAQGSAARADASLVQDRLSGVLEVNNPRPTVTAEELAPGFTYVFSLTATNFLGAQVTVSSTSMPCSSLTKRPMLDRPTAAPVV